MLKETPQPEHEHLVSERARLIAAAPDMAEALEAVLAYDGEDPMGSGPDYRRVAEALAKARGEVGS